MLDWPSGRQSQPVDRLLLYRISRKIWFHPLAEIHNLHRIQPYFPPKCRANFQDECNVQ
jgi:hypothetical protein